jgi:integrase
MASINPRKASDGSIRYRVQVRLRGYPAQVASFERLAEAKRWAVQTEAGLREGRIRLEATEPHTVADLFDRYAESVPTAQDRLPQLNWWRKHLGSLDVSEVTPSLIASLREALAKGKTPSGRKASPGTQVRYLACLSHAFTFAVDDLGWLASNPLSRVRRPKEPRGRVRFLDDLERGRLLDACRASHEPRLYQLVVFALSTGARRGEILAIRWRDLDLNRRLVTLQETKNGERRSLPLAGPVLEVLRELAKSKPERAGLVFGAEKGREAFPRSAWDRALKEAEIENFRFHDLRHSAASYLAMGGATLAEIAAVLGHKTLAMVKRYAHLSDSHVAGVVERMNARIFSDETTSP